jgi:putative transposase
VPVSHPFVERMIRTIREELLDQVLFWNLLDLERKLSAFQTYYNRYRVRRGIGGTPPEHVHDRRRHCTSSLGEIRWMSHCHGIFDLPAAA